MIPVDPEASPIQVIEKCAAVISMPFTSTAIIGSELGKPSVYYDPSGVIEKNDKGAHGIPVISGRSELEAWIKKTFEGRKQATVNTNNPLFPS
jgi:polysaccharide biosynthesis PFTS motif protein